MRPIVTPKQIVDGLLGNLKRKVARAVDEAKRVGIEQARDLSPRPGSPHGDHPYAEGEYARSWVWKGTRLVNTAPHARYTDDGVTRYRGRQSARPWLARGGRRYSDMIAEAVALTLRRALGRAS